MPTPRSPAQRPPRLARASRMPIRKTGPKFLQLGREPVYATGPGQPPPGFVGPSTSAHEWPWYWASKRVFDPDDDPLRPPFEGGHGWDYQRPEHQFLRLVTAVDFVYFLPGQMIGVRIQTPFFHRGVEKGAFDDAQARNLSRFMIVRDVFSQDFVQDRTGEAAIKLLIDTLGGRARLNPFKVGTFYPARPNTQ